MSGPGQREIGLGVQSDKQPGEYAAIAGLAEAHGIDVLSVYGDLTYQPPMGPLLEMAAATERVRLGPACLNPYTMHPYEIAGQIAGLDMVSGGRAYLGMARGAWLGAIGIDQPRPLTYLAEAVAFITSLLSADGRGFEGEIFRLEPGTRLAYDPLRSRIPLMIGTWGARTLQLAASLNAAEVKIGGSANPAIVPFARGHLGNPGADVGIVVGAVSVVDEDAAAARRLARAEVAMYLAVVADLDPTVDVPGDVLAAVREQVAAGDKAGAGRTIPDEILDRFALAGTPADVAAQTSALFAAGANRVEFGTPHGLMTATGIELIGSEVMPRIEY